MGINYLIADSITRIRNAIMRNSKYTILANSNFVRSVLKVLYDNGYIGTFEVLENKIEIKVNLKYFEKKSVINFLKIYSTPGRRQYIKSDLVLKGVRPKNLYGLWILSTNKGVMSHVEAYEKNVGGELIMEIH